MHTTDFIHTFKPGTSLAAPTLLLLHGTGGNEESLLDLGEELLPGANIISPRGKVLEHGMPRFFRRLSEGVFDIEDLKHRTDELRDFITSSRVTYNLKTSPLYAVGYSNGANIAASLLLSYPHIVDAAVLFRAMLPFMPDTLPNLKGTSVLMLNGEHDTMITHDSATALLSLLQQAGANTQQRWQPTGHQLSMSDVLAAREWLQEV